MTKRVARRACSPVSASVRVTPGRAVQTSASGLVSFSRHIRVEGTKKK